MAAQLARHNLTETIMEEEYWTECDACMTETQVMVVDQEEVPQYCPMCGSTAEYDTLED